MRRSFLCLLLYVSFAFPLLPLQAAAGPSLTNGLVTAVFDDRGLVTLKDCQLSQTVRLLEDGFAFIIEHHLVESHLLRPRKQTAGPNSVEYTYRDGPFTIQVLYELRPGWRFISKRLLISNNRYDVYTVRHVDVWRGRLQNQPADVHVANLGDRYKRTRGLGDYAAFLRMPGKWGVMLLTQNPFAQWRWQEGRFSMDYRAEMDWRSEWGPFPSDRACLGIYALTGRRLPAAVSSHESWLMQPEWQKTDAWIDQGEVDAFVECVRPFLLYQPAKSVRVHVPWCENDYQIDVARENGAAQFKRIVDAAASIGIQHMLYTVRNDQIALQKDASDAWGWEHLLWLNMGIQVRKNQWDPKHDPLPPRTRQLMAYAENKGLKLMAYVYPTVAFEQNRAWLTRRHWSKDALAANLAFRSFQDWLIDNLIGFAQNTGISGYSFDYWTLRSVGASVYAQWWGTRRVLEELRKRKPDIIIDGRQTYHTYGPWIWLAGTYPHPMGGDEQPESFEAFPDLHVDRCYGNQQRLTAYWYHNVQLCPIELIPGCIGHQTARRNADGQVIYDRDFNIRDWDYLGWKYSLLSSIATAPFAHCVGMIPARDEQEYRAFAKDQESRRFIRRWFDWTDRHAELLKRLRWISGPPAIGQWDGTAAIDGDHGFVFLFNPNYRRVTARFALDESIGLKSRQRFLIKELYPEEGKLLGSRSGTAYRYGDQCSFLLDGTSARVLEIQPLRQVTKPVLLGVSGKASLEGDRLILSNVRGEVGTQVTAHVLLPGKTVVRSAEVNGRRAAVIQKGEVAELKLCFAGHYFPRNKPLTQYDPNFAGRALTARFSIPQRIFQQLQRRRRKWPIRWTAEDLQCSWLAPERLLLFIQIAEPNWQMKVSAKIDGRPVTVRKAYTSRTPGLLKQGKGHNTFVGFYIDVSRLAADEGHQLEVTLPTGLKPGQFQGIFFDNVETEYTDDVLPQAPSG